MVASICVLVVEDEVLLHPVLQSPLEDGGYRVVIRASGEEAVAELEKDPGAFQALITDVNLGKGKLSGWDVARRARELNPLAPVIYMTGDSSQDWSSQGVPGSVLLTKPFASAQAVTAVSQLLTAASMPQAPPPESPS